MKYNLFYSLIRRLSCGKITRKRFEIEWAQAQKEQGANAPEGGNRG